MSDRSMNSIPCIRLAPIRSPNAALQSLRVQAQWSLGFLPFL